MISLFLFIILVTISIFSFYFDNKSFLSPSFAFSLSFAIAVFNGLTNYNKWNFELHSTTTILIGASVTLFCAICYSCNILNKSCQQSNSIELKPFYLPSVFYYIFLLIQIISTYLSLKTIQSIGSQHGSDGTLSNSILAYRSASLYSSSFTGLPGYITFLSNVCTALGYICIYNAVTDYFYNKNKNYPAIVSSFIVIISPLMYGGRGASLLILFFFITVLLLEYENNAHTGRGYKIVPLIFFISFVFLVIIAFYASLSLMGRSSGSFDFYYYLSIYIGAPIKNLDTYLNAGIIQPSMDCVATCSSDVYMRINNITSASQSFKFTDFQNYNGFDLGNVYTTLYSFVHDFGFIGSIILVIIMAFISQFIYLKIIKIHSSVYNVIYLYIYSMVFYSLSTSFFSNQFYKTIFTSIVLKYIIIWLVFGFIYFHTKFNKLDSDFYIN